MPTVLRVDGFHVRIYTQDHTQRAHVHVWKAGKVVVINLASGTGLQEIERVEGMRIADITKAFHLVEENTEYLLEQWRKLYGDAGT